MGNRRARTRPDRGPSGRRPGDGPTGEIVWRKRRWVCPERACPIGSFVEQDARVAAARARLTTRACWWLVEQIRREHASVNGLRRQLGTSWRTVWDAIRPLLQHAARGCVAGRGRRVR
ncbi:helix-turn-helix domain-containing protein [Dermatophilaceae bacterium Soc4.6]